MSMHFTTKAVVITEATVFLQYPRLQSNIKSKKNINKEIHSDRWHSKNILIETLRTKHI